MTTINPHWSAAVKAATAEAEKLPGTIHSIVIVHSRDCELITRDALCTCRPTFRVNY